MKPDEPVTRASTLITTGKVLIGDTPIGNSPGPSMSIGEKVTGTKADYQIIRVDF
jgi:hypothetical protein